MLKKRYKLFGGLFVLLIGLSAFLSQKFPYTYETPAVADYSLRVEPTAETALDNVPLFFSFEENDVVLQCTSEVEECAEDIFFRYGYGEEDCVPLEDFSYGEDMNGTVLVQSQNADGSVLVSAKASPLITQGFDAYAWDSHVFGEEEIPVEICYGGSATMSTEISVLLYGQPYNGRLHLQSVAGKDAAMEVRDGVVQGLSIHDLRQGLAVTIVDENTGVRLIGTYVVEDYPMFSSGYGAALGNFFLLIGLVAVGCGIVFLIRMIWKKRERETSARVLTE